MTTRIDIRFQALREARRAALVAFVMAGDPDPATSSAIIEALPAAGVDGLIVVDLPPEEDDELCLPTLRAGLNFIRLSTPTTDDRRLPMVLTNTSGFVYYVSIAGVTGSSAPDAQSVAAAVARIKSRTQLPVAVGFGVRDAASAAVIAAHADGVVVGSAIVEALHGSLRNGRAGPDTVAAVVRLVDEIASRVQKVVKPPS